MIELRQAVGGSEDDIAAVAFGRGLDVGIRDGNHNGEAGKRGRNLGVIDSDGLTATPDVRAAVPRCGRNREAGRHGDRRVHSDVLRRGSAGEGAGELLIFTATPALGGFCGVPVDVEKAVGSLRLLYSVAIQSADRTKFDTRTSSIRPGKNCEPLFPSPMNLSCKLSAAVKAACCA